ncbi:hypothetical protein [Limosilactobacillus reuteri]|uniref:hypothetical protein n=1 Tax=Limosilactobacillus reuteri TaxID=1598 RepID=UPI0024BBAB21|nr:hypothetical protein [Limosilactobacillus reuteri]
MKIKEAIEIINGSTSTVLAKESNGFLHMYRRDFKVHANWFLEMPIDVTNWDSICSDWDCLSNIEPQDLARVMDVIQRLLDTPVEERFPEKKYRLRWIDDQGHCKNYLNLNSNGAWVFMDDEIYAEIFTESELEQLKKDNPRLAPAIDAMKEPAEDKDDE